MRSHFSRPDTPRALGRVLAMLLAAQPEPDQGRAAMHLLASLQAFDRIGLPEAEFERLVRQLRHGDCQALAQHVYPHARDLESVDQILDQVHDQGHRLLLARLAACLITADGQVSELESALYDHMLWHWGYTRASVTRAILAGHVH